MTLMMLTSLMNDKLLTRINIPDHILTGLKVKYAGPNRFYHTWDHIKTMFNAACVYDLKLTPEQEWAILYHDAVYFIGTKSYSDIIAEQTSARLAFDELEGILSLDSRKEIYSYIMATAFHTSYDEGFDQKTKVVLDLDLYSMSTYDYVKNNAGIYKECMYYGISKEDYIKNRIKFLKKMLERKQIFYYDIFNEKMARYNLEFEYHMLTLQYKVNYD